MSHYRLKHGHLEVLVEEGWHILVPNNFTFMDSNAALVLELRQQANITRGKNFPLDLVVDDLLTLAVDIAAAHLGCGVSFNSSVTFASNRIGISWKEIQMKLAQRAHVVKKPGKEQLSLF